MKTALLRVADQETPAATEEKAPAPTEEKAHAGCAPLVAPPSWAAAVTPKGGIADRELWQRALIGADQTRTRRLFRLDRSARQIVHRTAWSI